MQKEAVVVQFLAGQKSLFQLVELARLTLSFDSKGKKGKQSKRVTITANTDPVQTFLTIKGEVKAPEGAEATPQPIKPQSPAQ